jgi:hypothetical protein
VLVPAKLWTARPGGDAWGRRLVLMVLGTLIGAGVLWLNGWTPRWAPPGSEVSLAPAESLGIWEADGNGIIAGSGYLAYFGLSLGALRFGLSLGALRWWRLADRRRKSWFSLFPVLAAGFWSLVLSFVWPWTHEVGSTGPQPMFGALALITAAAIVQWVSPWEPPPPPPPRRLRLRYA